MNATETVAMGYACNVFNEMLRESGSQSHIQLVWNTSFGLAHLTTVQTDNYGQPVISEKITPESFSQETIHPGDDSEKNIFFAVRHAMIKEFHTSFGWVHLDLTSRPDLLLSLLTKVVTSAVSPDLQVPNYQSVWEFKKLDGSISLPFISKGQIEIFGVASLISKNSTDNE
jgi:hypothetical protein